MQLKGKRIIVTGGSRGIGESVVRGYVKEGAIVSSLDILDELGELVIKDCNEKGPGSAKYYHCDITIPEEVNKIFAQAINEMGGLDVLAHIAGLELNSKAEDITVEQLNTILDVNVKGTVFANQQAFKALKENGGVIINFGSDAALKPHTNAADYSAAKGAVTSWTRTIAHEWGQYGIRANTLVPVMKSPLYEAHRNAMNAEELARFDEHLKRNIPLGGRMGDPEEDLVPVMVFLAGEGSKYITAQIISVNGGVGWVR